MSFYLLWKVRVQQWILLNSQIDIPIKYAHLCPKYMCVWYFEKLKTGNLKMCLVCVYAFIDLLHLSIIYTYMYTNEAINPQSARDTRSHK